MSSPQAKRPSTTRLIWLIAVFLAGMAGCRGPDYAAQKEDLFELPAQFASYPIAHLDAQSWCRSFHSPELEALIGQAFTNNLSLRAAAARLRQAEAVARQSRAGLWPSLDAEGRASRTKFGEASGFPSLGSSGGSAVPGGAGPTGAVSFEGTENPRDQFSLSLGASYEVDLWGRLRNNWRAAQLDAAAVREDARTMAITLAAQIAEAWFQLVTQREKLDLLQDQIKVSQQFLELIVFRFGVGQATALDANQQKQQTESLRGQSALAMAAEGRAQHQLAVLVGEPPEALFDLQQAALPTITPLPDPGIPSGLLQRRPDIRAASLRLEGGDKRIAAAIADRFPKLRLSASVLFQEQSLGRLVDELLWSLAAAVAQPIVDGGRRRAAVEQADAAAEEQLYQYGQTVLTALQEVEDALISEARQAEFVDSLREQLQIARTILELARERYQQGAADYLRVLTALQSLQQIEQNLLDARRQQFSFRIQLCRALGGDWTGNEIVPDLTVPTDELGSVDRQTGLPDTLYEAIR